MLLPAVLMSSPVLINGALMPEENAMGMTIVEMAVMNWFVVSIIKIMSQIEIDINFKYL